VEVDRDLARPDLWEQSLARSRARREAAARRPAIELPVPARKVSATALAMLAGGPVVGVSAAQVIGGDDGGARAASGAGAKPPAVATVERASAEDPAVALAATEGDPAPAKPAPRRDERPAESKEKPEPKAKTSFRVVEEQEAEPVAAVAAVDKNVKPGGGVEELQEALGVPVDGDFGARTERALERFQRRHGLAADGVAGPDTREALGIGGGKVLKRERGITRRVRRGGDGGGGNGGGERARRGGGVKALQQALGVTADGVFGPGTERALKRWQRAHGLTADGVAGPQTREALGLGPGPVLKRKGGGGGGGRGSSPSGGDGVVARVIAAANEIATKPYRYGGGHGSFTDSGYDCSGSISYALHGGGLLSSPLDSSAFMSWGAPGPGKRITIYANPGHAFMVVDGRRFDTSARSETGSRWSSTMRSTAGYVARHPRGL
jgi:peptidoglycan hydrolase-like protein with peptidoglycan-binding domain